MNNGGTGLKDTPQKNRSARFLVSLKVKDGGLGSLWRRFITARQRETLVVTNNGVFK